MQTDKDRFKVASYFYDKAAEVGLLSAADLVQFRLSVLDDWQSGADRTRGTGEVDFHPSLIWRIKPDTVTHPGGEHPKPCYSADEMHSVGFAYFPAFTISHNGEVLAKAEEAHCQNINNCEIFASTGMYHLTKEAAIAHAKVIFQIED